MNGVAETEDERRFLRWSGLAGVAGSIVFLVVVGIVIVFVGPYPANTEGFLRRFPDVRAARTAENTLYLVVLLLWAANFLGLYRALRRTSLSSALFGSVAGVLGLGIMASGALVHVATLRLSNVYHAEGSTASQREAVVVAWEATQGIFDALLFAGLAILPIALVVLGIGMRGTPGLGKRYSWLSVLLGVVAGIAAVVFLIDPLSSVAPVGVFVLVVFHLVLGWKLYGISKSAPEG